MTPLCEIALKYNTDKVRVNKDSHHDYTEFYHPFFQGRRVQRLLEIGISHGGSLRMWRDYFPHAEIYGIDIKRESFFEDERIHCLQCDQSKIESLRTVGPRTGGRFDVIIDDGSHIPLHQVVSFQVLYPLLTPGGVYIIEDVSDDAPATRHIKQPYKIERRVFCSGWDNNLIIVPKV
jgi:hypothetical protein